MDHLQLNKLPAEYQQSITRIIQMLKETLIGEAARAFSEILASQAEQDIYSLSLYYSAGSWNYIFPTVASEHGLEQVTQEFVKHSPLTLEQQKIALRWSLTDSPHHGDSEMEGLLPMTHLLLDELESLIAKADPETGSIAWPENNDKGYDNFYDLIIEIHSLIHDAVVEALIEIARVPEIAEYRSKRQCVISLSAVDLSEDDFLEDVKKINGVETYLVVRDEFDQATQLEDDTGVLWEDKLSYNQNNSPSTDLILENFLDVINNFSPSFKVVDGGVFVNRDEYIDLTPDSAGEADANRFELMELLQDSPHFEEIDRLYGHFIANNFAADDLLPSIGRALTNRLEILLLKAFPERSFFVSLSVQRHSLYFFTFWQNRQDGFTPWLKYYSLDSGVTELNCIGPLPPTLILPCGLFRVMGLYIAQAYGFPVTSFESNRGNDKRPIAASSPISYQKALAELEKISLTYFDKVFVEDRLNLKVIEYPEAVLKNPEQAAKYSAEIDRIERWTCIEIAPKFIWHHLNNDADSITRRML